MPEIAWVTETSLHTLDAGNMMFFLIHSQTDTVGWGCRKHQLHLCRGVKLPTNECPGYDTKQSDGEPPVMLEFSGMQSTPSLPSLPGSLWAPSGST